MKKINKIKGKKVVLLSLLLASVSLAACDYSNVDNNKLKNFRSINDGTSEDIESNERLISYGINTNETLSDEYKEQLINFFNNIIEKELPSKQIAYSMKVRINTTDFTDLTFEEIIQTIFEFDSIEEAYDFIEYYNNSVSKIEEKAKTLKLI